MHNAGQLFQALTYLLLRNQNRGESEAQAARKPALLNTSGTCRTFKLCIIQVSNDGLRNAMIADDIVRAIESGRSPLLLTGRTEHLQYFATRLSRAAQHVFVLKGGMGKKQRRLIAEAMAAAPDNESRVILATGSYIGEGFDDARLDTLFLAMPISWKGTLQQYAGRLHRLHDNKRVVQVYDYIDNGVPMLARMYGRRLKGYSAIGYAIDQATDRMSFL